MGGKDFSGVYLSWADSSSLEVSSEIGKDLHLWGIICMLLACERGKRGREREKQKHQSERNRKGGSDGRREF